MLRLSKFVASTALGLTISFSLFTPGAFAQSINQNTTNHPVVSQTTTVSENAEQGVKNYYPGWTNNGHNNYRRRYERCVNVSRWVRTRHGSHRVWYRVCHWY